MGHQTILRLGVVMSLLAGHAKGADLPPGNSIRIAERTLDGEAAVVLANRFYESILLPHRAMMPLTLRVKATGKELFVRAPDMAAAVARQNGNMICLPWVSDALGKGASKGLLRTAEWRVTLEQDGGRAACRAETRIAYRDPVSGAPAALGFVQVTRGTADSPALAMDFAVSNPGAAEARCVFVAHPRVTPGGAYQAGDYVYVPGTNAWIGDFQWPSLSDAGVRPNQWMPWPRDDLMRFEPRTGSAAKGNYAYVFVPARWALMGNDRTREFLLFHASPLTLAGREQDGPYFCLLHRDGDYLLEISAARALGTDSWREPWGARTLAPGETLAYTLTLVPGRGLDYAAARRVTEATPARLLLAPESGGAPVAVPLAPPRPE